MKDERLLNGRGKNNKKEKGRPRKTWMKQITKISRKNKGKQLMK